jgi:hypothetical protein
MSGDLTLNDLVPSTMKQDLCSAFTGVCNALTPPIPATHTRACTRPQQQEHEDDGECREESPSRESDVHR